MTVATELISLEQYSNMSFRPDVELIDGVLKERKLGTVGHSRLQALLASMLFALEEQHKVMVLTECRLQISASRCRVPDLMVVDSLTDYPKIYAGVPRLIIEVMSPDDTLADYMERGADYETLGCQQIYLADPVGRRAWQYSQGNLRTAHAIAEFGVSLDEAFAKLGGGQ